MKSQADALNQISAFAWRLDQLISAALRGEFDRPLSELSALVSIQNCKSFNIGWLANVLELTHSATVRLVDRLEGDDLIERLPKDHRKQVGLRITAKGRDLAGNILQARERVAGRFLAPLSKGQLSALAELSRTVITHNVTNELDSYQVCALCDEASCGKLCPRLEASSCLPESQRER
jgi:DNA-binding MarR family transcriptional regulator